LAIVHVDWSTEKQHKKVRLDLWSPDTMAECDMVQWFVLSHPEGNKCKIKGT